MKFKGNYSGNKALSFRVDPAGTRISLLTRHKKSFTAKWKRQTAKMAKSKVSGYKIRYSTYSSMKNAKIKTIKGYNKSHTKVTGLKSHKNIMCRSEHIKKFLVKITIQNNLHAKEYISNKNCLQLVFALSGRCL